MPVVSGILTAEPTPYKKRKRTTRLSDKEHDKDEDRKNKAKTDYTTKPFNSSKLRKKYNFGDGQVMNVWNEAIRQVEERKICAFTEDLKGHELPATKREKGESKVFGLAAQAFNVATDPSTCLPGYITGNLVLPPRGIKDAEGVGICAQAFTVGDCQPNSVEIAIADPEVNGGKFEPNSAQRRLLTKGEMFHVPPGNIYRIENHSRKVACTLYWTIIKPFKRRSEE
mmetsp:Transcript_10995/g.16624  ORF Transcript_10995/g.16624 Transcript_10995/m.16624 type:complete len:226 (+) Transcript_10995:4950-5627(+)